MDEKTVAIIQARMGSTRLPGKVMKKIKGKTVLRHVVERVGQSELVDEIIVATTMCKHDNVIEEEALSSGAKVFRGSEDDVLARYYYAAKEIDAGVIVRITSDCPLIDPRVVDALVSRFMSGNYDIATNAGADLLQRTFPRGLDTEVFSFEILEQAFSNAKKTYQREHVTPYIYENGKNVFYYKNDVDYSKFRWTLDTEEDFELISKIYDELYNGEHNFYLEEIIGLFDREPDLYQINSHVEQKKLR